MFWFTISIRCLLFKNKLLEIMMTSNVSYGSLTLYGLI